jgi:DNA-binding GntR family transcriptional regulator
MQSTTRRNLELPVARTILEDISAGKLLAGARVPEAAYSARCGVSRTPVRQALRFLQKLRSVVIRSNLGARVRSTPADAKRILKSAALNGSRSRGIEPAFVDVAQRIKDLLAREHSPGENGGEIIKDSAIARRLGVSRTTANRGLALLARQNLLEPLPRRGWKRVVMGPREVADLYDFRIAVEPAALESGFEHFDLASMNDLLARSLAVIRPKKQPPMCDLVALDIELHRAILHACRNRMLRRAMEEQEALRVIAVLPPWRVLGRMQDTFREHAAVLRAILKSDRAAAAAALRKHLVRARDTIVKSNKMSAAKALRR